MRAEFAAALANFLLILLIAVGLTSAGPSTSSSISA